MPTRRPQWPIDATIRAAHAVLPLAITHRAKLEPRLAAGFLDGLRADAVQLEALVSGTTLAYDSKRASTITQDEAIAAGRGLLSQLRGLVRTGLPDDAAFQRAVGVGAELNASVSGVAAGLRRFTTANQEAPAKVRASGILPTDVTEAGALVATLTGANEIQEGKKTSATRATAQRNLLAVRTEDQLRHLDSVAARALPADVAAVFSAQLPTRPARAKKPPPAPK